MKTMSNEQKFTETTSEFYSLVYHITVINFKTVFSQKITEFSAAIIIFRVQ